MSLSSINWPVVAYPTQDGSKTLEEVKSLLRASRENGKPVAAVVVEPTNWQTGHVAGDDFIRQLRSVAHEAEAALVVDETNTGCGATGKGFWQYNGDADYVAFGRRTQVTGFFSKHLDHHGHSDLHLGGSQLDLIRFQIVKEEIEKSGLVKQVASVGKDLLSGAQRAAEKSTKIKGVRGVGTLLWVDTKDA